jgi:exosortase/archaeosortase family protein
VTPDAPGASSPASSFALRLTGWSLALFGVFRLPWVGAHVFLPGTQLQAAAGAALLGPSTLPIEATLACSGADALALCLAAIVAYPAAWRTRAAGAVVGVVAIVALNIVRIGTLGRAVASPLWFHTLHVYVWPLVLTVAIAGIVFTWMRAADGLQSRSVETRGRAKAVTEHAGSPISPALSLRFALVAGACLVLFTLASPLYLESPRVLALAVMVARAAAVLLRGAGIDATASAGVLATPGGAFLVTQECIATPLIPIYFAAVLVSARGWRRLALWTAAAVPLFVALGIARLLVVAIPAGLDRPPAFLVHAFSQIAVAAGLVCVAARWRYGAGARTYARAAGALLVAVLFMRLLGGSYTTAFLRFSPAPVADAQGALLFMPAFQFALFLALWVAAFVPSGWARFLCGASLLAAIQIAVGAGVQLLVVHAGVSPLVRDVRAWSLAGPILIIATVINLAPARR